VNQADTRAPDTAERHVVLKRRSRPAIHADDQPLESAETALLKSEEQQAVIAAIQRLPARQREDSSKAAPSRHSRSCPDMPRAGSSALSSQFSVRWHMCQPSAIAVENMPRELRTYKFSRHPGAMSTKRL
jgi:hypothetical protein